MAVLSTYVHSPRTHAALRAALRNEPGEWPEMSDMESAAFAEACDRFGAGELAICRRSLSLAAWYGGSGDDARRFSTAVR